VKIILPPRKQMAPKSSAEGACRDYRAASLMVKKLSEEIAVGLAQCVAIAEYVEQSQRENAQFIEMPPTHLKRAYSREMGGGGGMYDERALYLDPAEQEEILSVCPGCMAAHRAIQARKIWKQKFGNAKRAVMRCGRLP
jgi:hypothetical protein